MIAGPSQASFRTYGEGWQCVWGLLLLKYSLPIKVMISSSSSPPTVIWYDMIWYDMIWCEVKWSEVRWGEVRWGEVRWGEVRWCDVMWLALLNLFNFLLFIYFYFIYILLYLFVYLTLSVLTLHLDLALKFPCVDGSHRVVSQKSWPSCSWYGTLQGNRGWIQRGVLG